MILFLVLANIAGIVKIQLSADRLAQVYPILPADQVKWLTALPVITIVSLIAIWAGKRWGIILTSLAFAVVLFLDVVYQVWPHALLATVGFVLLLFFCWQSRQFFGEERNSGN